jgi:hypothetical protein
VWSIDWNNKHKYRTGGGGGVFFMW